VRTAACMEPVKRGRQWSSSSESTPRPPQKRPTMDLENRVQAALRQAIPSTTSAEITSVISAVITGIIPVIIDVVTDSVQKAFQSRSEEIDLIKDDLFDHAWRIDANEQYSRRDNIRITGIAPPENEDDEWPSTNEIVTETCEKMGIKITDQDISTSHWLPSKKPTIIAKFVRRDTKAEIMRKKKNLTKKDPSVFEDLTRFRQELLLEIQSCSNISRAFTRDGVIHCFMKDQANRRNETRVRIKDPHDLIRIGWNDDDIRWLYPMFGKA
jgi:hypothetical protein